jgi:DNA-binding transcriptional regulator YiaG
LLFCHLRLKAPKPISQAYPRQLLTICHHLRKRRLDLGLFQAQVAQQLGVDETTVHNWEARGRAPALRHLPKIIGFLGYNPLPLAQTLAEQLIRHRKMLGLSRDALALRLGIDPGTLRKWETQRSKPKDKYLKLVMDWIKQRPRQE